MRCRTTIRIPASKRFRASETEQASIRALKNWLLAAPPENPLDDQIVRQRLSAAIAIAVGGASASASRDAKAPS